MGMEIKFQSSNEHYVADACVAWCFDDRFTPLMGEFLKQFSHLDVVKVAGGAKALAGGPSPERDFVLGQIKASVRLHATKRIILMVHIDCGAYGGSKVFNNDMAQEKTHHEKELAVAVAFLNQEISGISILCVLADFDGLYEVPTV